MAGLKRFQYANIDYDDIVSDTIAYLKEKHGENIWNDFEEDSSGVMLVEAVAYIFDKLLFYLERQANETYISTATERQNVINQCKLIGYRPYGARPAQVDITVSIKDAHATDVTLPAGTQVETQGGVIFETKTDAVIEAGTLSTVVGATQGETFEDSLGVSDGEAYQEFYLPRVGVIEIISLLVGEHEWDAVDSVAEQLSDAQVYTAELDAWGRCRISFGNGTSGQIPHRGERITVKYRIGGGVSGNVAPNTLTSVRDIATDENGDSVPVSVTNLEWAAGGSDPESIEHIRLWGPRYFETQKRCVTQQDYETFAMAYNDPDTGAIAKVRAVVHERSGEANVIRIYVLAYGSEAGAVALAPQTLKNALLNYLNQYKMLTDWLEIMDGEWRAVNFSGALTLLTGFKSAEVLENVKEALAALLETGTREMGEPLRISDVYAAIDGVDGVAHVELNTPTETVAAGANELLVLGNVNFSVETERASGNGKNI